MRSDGLPLSRWSSCKKSFLLTPEDIKDIDSDFSAFMTYWVFLGYSDFPKHQMLHLIDEIYDFELISKLILGVEIRTHDSVLLSIAIKQNCKYFVTTDFELLNKKNKIKKIEVIHPKNMSNKIKKSEI